MKKLHRLKKSATASADEEHEVEAALEMHQKIYGPGNTWPTFIIFVILFNRCYHRLRYN